MNKVEEFNEPFTAQRARTMYDDFRDGDETLIEFLAYLLDIEFITRDEYDAVKEDLK